MPKLFGTIAFFLLFTSIGAQGYKVTLHTPNYTSGLCYLTYYYGNKINIADSAIVNGKGVALFRGDKKLLPGIYAIVFPGKYKLVDFLIDSNQAITVEADTADLLKTKITGGGENQVFREYQKFIASKSGQLEKERIAYSTSKNKKDSVLHENNYKALNHDLTIYRQNIIQKYPESMLASLFNAMHEPAALINKPVTRADSVDNYNYYKKHYWDGITFMDDRIIRTPFFLPKLEKYFRDVLVPAPDSIIREADYLLLLARSSQEMYKFLLNWFTDEYIYPKYMGQDAVFVHLFEKYHSTGISTWLNEKQMTTISNRAYMIMSNLIGEKAANLEMTDTMGKTKFLFDVDAPYTIVAFWDPTCGHCREEIPRLDSMFQNKWKKQGVKIYGVLTENEKEKWVEFIHQKHLKDWVHVYQTDAQKKAESDLQKPAYRQLYDVTQTPTLYLLDKDKRIIAKKLNWQQLDDMLQMKIKNKQPD
ncbi:MAG: redoxin domain-containing protein [Ginsengibacter sp.]